MQDNMRLPAEWEAQSAVLLTWPHAGTDWKDCLEDITRTYVEMAAAITRFERLIVVAPDVAAVERLLRQALSQEQMARVIFHECPTNDTWARDHGFISLIGNHDFGRSEVRLLDFRFNGWGEKFLAELDNAINRSLFRAGIVSGAYENHDDFVLEGGSIESDGCGTILTTTGCLLAPHRNQPLTKDEIEEQLKRRLHADHVLWLDHGHLEGDDTDGHVDTLARLAPHDTILYIRCTDVEDAHYADLKAMEDDLKALRTKEGKPYRLLPLPMTRPITEDSLYSTCIPDSSCPASCQNEERLPATYANFLVINDALLFPTYGQPDLDAEAERVLAEAFPGLEMIGIDCRTVIRQHGSLHCCTMQFPASLSVAVSNA